MKIIRRDTLPTRFRYSLLLREIDNMRAERGVSAVGLVLIQLSGLEDVNDRFGYVGGDKLLEEFISRLATVARKQDRTYEINGNAFALLIRNPLHEGHVVLAAEKIATLSEQPLTIGSERARIRVRSGVSLLPNPARSSEELLRQCEIALEVARLRDEPHTVFTSAFGEIADAGERHTWFDLDEALKAGEFELRYQPKVALPSGRLVGAEALLRWQSPRLGLVSPARFLPAIERTQGIRAVLRFALNAALRQAAVWTKLRPAFSVAVNLAAGNLADDDLVQVVDSALNVWSVPPSGLVLELTESSLMSDPASSIRKLGRLRALGVKTSIDDFGTGYSSFAYLKDLPANELKVDKSFVQLVAKQEKERRIVASIVQLAHAVGLTVVGEGVEDAATMSTLASIGCDAAQGYYFAAPLTAGDFEKIWIRGAGAVSSP
jgi:diguanylate cyclase (GGDEF)-like protein